MLALPGPMCLLAETEQQAPLCATLKYTLPRMATEGTQVQSAPTHSSSLGMVLDYPWKSCLSGNL